MSRMKLATKLRQNAEYPAVVDLLDQLGLKFELFPPPGKGHPFLQIAIPGREPLIFHVNCTPRAGGNPKSALGRLRRALRSAGVAV